MTLGVTELRQRIAASQGKTFEITGAEIGDEELIERHLGGALTVRQASAGDLTVTGTSELPEAANLAVTVTFTAAASGDQLAGFEIAFTLLSWKFHTQAASEDFGYLTGFGFQKPRFLLRGNDDGAVLGCVLGGSPYRVPIDGDGPPVADSGDGTTLHDVTQAFGCGLAADLNISLSDVWFRYDHTSKTLMVSGNAKLTTSTTLPTLKWALMILPSRGSTGSRRYVGMVTADLTLKLSGLPVVAGLVPAANDLVMNHVTLLFSTEGLDGTDVQDINTLLKDAKKDFPQRLAPQLPPGPLDSGVTASLAYDLGGAPRDAIKIRLGEASRIWQDLPDDGPSSAADQPAAPESSGPLRLGRINLGYAMGAVQIRLDFTVTVCGLAFEASGFGFSVPLANPATSTFVLNGLGFSATVNPVKIGAALRWRGDATWPVRFEGAGMVTAPVISVLIAGSYAQKADGTPSLFLFGQLKVGSGAQAGFGPPPFRVKDICLGGGYNTEVRVPELTDVDTFPLLTGFDDQATPLGVLETLTGGFIPWVTPKVGENWIAAGLHWTTFEFADFRAMVLAEFGESLVLSLLGLGRFDFPKNLPQGVRPAVRVEIAAQALYRQGEGLLSLTAYLTSASYIYDKECKPTGGLALCTWVAPSPHAGDFVVSVGGYHPGFVKPGHYPAVPRVGITWSISDKVSLKADAYAAVTPHAAMLGGALAVTFDSGWLRAWFTAHLDALIRWSPFSFDVALGVSVGVKASFDIGFIHFSVSIEVGVDVDLWGPPVGGLATVHLWFISFDIGFGAGRPDGLPPASWTQFQEQLPPKMKALQSNPVEGLSYKPRAPDSDAAASLRASEAAAEPWSTSTHGFSFVTSSAVPATQVVLGGQTVARDEGQPLHIRPMEQGGLTSTHAVSISQHGREIDHQSWTVEPVRSQVPEALWGPGQSSLSGSGLLTDRLTGLRISIPAPQFSGGLTVRPGVLDLDPLVPEGTVPLNPAATAPGPLPRADPNTVAIIAATGDGIAAGGTAERRLDLYTQLASLGYGPGANDAVSGYAALVRADLAAEPLLVPTGE